MQNGAGVWAFIGAASRVRKGLEVFGFLINFLACVLLAFDRVFLKASREILALRCGPQIRSSTSGILQCRQGCSGNHRTDADRNSNPSYPSPSCGIRRYLKSSDTPAFEKNNRKKRSHHYQLDIQTLTFLPRQLDVRLSHRLHLGLDHVILRAVGRGTALHRRPSPREPKFKLLASPLRTPVMPPYIICMIPYKTPV